MEFREFCDYVKDNILDHMPSEYEGAEVTINETVKNNSIVRQGLNIRRDGKNIAPNLYLDYAYSQYKDGASLDETMNKIASEYANHDSMEIGFDTGMIFDFDKVKDSITTRILNGKQNRTMAATRPNKKVDDLLVFYQITIEQMDDGTSSIPITNEIMRSWGVSTQEIHNIAVENTERIFPSQLVDMEGILFGGEENLFEKSDENTDGKLLVLKNEANIYGASAIANPDVLRKVSEVVKDDYYILPSSVNEVLIVSKESAKQMGMTPKDLGAMVRSVNETEVSKEELLSDHVYSYDKELKTLETVKESKEKSKDMER